MSGKEPDSAADPPKEDFADLYENAPCGYLSIRPDGRIFKVNGTFSAWMGFSREQLGGRRLHDLLNVSGRIFFETHFAPLLRMQGFFNEVALDFVTHNGDRLPVLVNAAEKRDDDGRHLFTRMTVFNATDRRRHERELLDARAAAEAAMSELRDVHAAAQANLLNERATAAIREQFIAVLSHDLRNPLIAIDSGMQMLLQMPMNEKARTIVNLVQGSTARMAGLIEDVMDFARGRLGGGLALVRDAAEPLEPVLRQVVAELRASAPEQGIETHFALTSPVNCDRRRIGQLASNLLGNALTHGASDKPIRISATTEGGQLELFVANGGNPIPPNVLRSIFEPFTRGAHRPSQQGLGLGLYISHEIARAHDGTLDVVSDEKETRFTFRMPLGV